MCPLAIASRAETGLSVTSTILTLPVESTCDSFELEEVSLIVFLVIFGKFFLLVRDAYRMLPVRIERVDVKFK